ncbi:MAG: hypothetical protein B7Z55_11200, partial [Planctomycetales bacterium 12-60-4]
MGTVDYMSPEQALDVRQADQRSDIYSLGVTLWFLLTGQPLFHADTAMKKLMAHQQEPIPALSKQRDDVPPQLDAIFARMVAKTPAARYQSMGNVIAALEVYQPSLAAAQPIDTGDSQLNQFLQGVSVPARSGKLPVSRSATATVVTLDPATDLATVPPMSMPTMVAGPPSVLAARRENSPPARVRKAPWLWLGGGACTVALLLLLLALAFRVGRQPPGNTVPQPNSRVAKSAVTAKADALTPAEPVREFVVAFHGGKNDYATTYNETIAHAEDLDAFTIEAWTRPDPDSKVGIVLGVGRLYFGTRQRVTKDASLDAYNAGFHRADGSYVGFVTSNSVPPKDWFSHYAFVCDAHGAMAFADGNLLRRWEWPHQGLTWEVIRKEIGPLTMTLGTAEHVGSATRKYSGQIREVRVSKVSRYNSNFTPERRFEPDADTLALYHCDEGNGQTLNDASGHGHSLVIVDGTWEPYTPLIDHSVGDSTPHEPATSGNGFVLEFDGVDDYATTQAYFLPEVTQLTWETWVK